MICQKKLLVKLRKHLRRLQKHTQTPKYLQVQKLVHKVAEGQASIMYLLLVYPLMMLLQMLLGMQAGQIDPVMLYLKIWLTSLQELKQMLQQWFYSFTMELTGTK